MCDCGCTDNSNEIYDFICPDCGVLQEGIEVKEDKYVCLHPACKKNQPERSKPFEAREDFVKRDYLLETPKAS